jgi:hypothetical protein
VTGRGIIAPWRTSSAHLHRLRRGSSEYAIDAKERRSLDASFRKMNENNMLGRVFAIAPMMEWTDRAEKQSVISP